MITAEEAVAAMEAEGVGVRRVPGGWVCERPAGMRPSPTIAEAAEVARAEIARRRAARDERSAARVIALQQRGRHFHRPRLEERPDDVEGTSQVLVFDIHRAGGAKTAIVGVDSIVEAYRLLAAAIARGEEP